jgi:hypothetical protein
MDLWTTVYIMCDPVDERRVTQCKFNAIVRLWFRGAPSPPYLFLYKDRFFLFVVPKFLSLARRPFGLRGENKSGCRMERRP